MKKLKAIDLFCGAGGFTSGLVKAGFEVLFAVDNWDVAVETHKLNFGNTMCALADIGNMSCTEVFKACGYLMPVDVDLLVGGPPCQGFSIQRIGSDNDIRNNLVIEFARWIERIKPKVFVMENVPGLIGKRGKQLVETFISIVDGAGYEVKYEQLNAADFGVPQIRKRVFFVGSLKEAGVSFSFPKPNCEERNWKTVMDAIGDLPEPPDNFRPPENDRLHRRTRLSKLNLQRLSLIPPGGGMQDLPVELRVNCHKAGPDKIGHRYVYGRLAPSKPAGTITARFDSFTRGKFAHPLSDRNITLREGARLQGFSDTFQFCGTQEEVAAQIGNAVPPRLAELLARTVVKSLRKQNAA